METPQGTANPRRLGRAFLTKSVWLAAATVLAAFGVELFCFLFPIRAVNRPYLNRVLDFPEFKNVIRTNSMGLREDSEIPMQKKAGEKRIVLIGDSFVFGFGVDASDTLSAQLGSWLKRHLPKAHLQVISSGAMGIGPIQYAHCLRTIAKPLNADLVIVCLYIGNDFENTIAPYLVFPYSLKNHLKFLFPNSYLWASGWKYNRKINDRNATVQIIRPDPWSHKELYRWGKWEGLSKTEMDRRLSTLSLRAQHWLKNRLVLPAYCYSALTHPQILEDTATLHSKGVQAGWIKSEQILKRMHRDCTRVGKKFCLVLIPPSFQVNDEQWDFLRTIGFSVDPSKLLQTKPQEELMAFCAREGMPCLDLLPVLKQSPVHPMYYERDEHWRPATVQYVARILGKYLENQGWLKN